MEHTVTLTLTVLSLVTLVICHEQQQFPPGVPPTEQHAHGAEQPPPPQQQPPQQQPPQQQPPQQQQQHQQQQHQQQQQQQQQQQHGHEHVHQQPGDNMGRNKLMESAIDPEHMKEHLEGIMNKPRDEMTPEELQFYYFKLHDYDNNGMLDGVELIKAITHFHNDAQDPNVAEQAKVFSDTEISDIVEAIMKQDDLNGDGYIEYMEFVTAQKRTPPEAEGAAPQEPPPS